MSITYTPILRWKTGEKTCLENLTPDVSSKIIPFVEVSPPADSSADEETAEKKLSKLISSFSISWENKPFYLYLSNDWYTNADSHNDISDIYEDLFQNINHPKAIPAFDITDEINISNIANLTTTNGVCLRISGDDFELLNQYLKNYVESSWITPQSTDLLIDLKYIDEEIYPKKTVFTTAISNISNIGCYRRIIIASCSFPKDISTIHSDIVNEFKRYETAIHEISLDLKSKFSFNYVYADYGPMNLSEITFARYMVPNFKIKYSTSDKYLVAKGLSLKKGGLELANVATSCRLLVEHPQFSGESFSYGDNIIATIANGTNTKSGNLTNWVAYSFNHHITLIVSLL